MKGMNPVEMKVWVIPPSKESPPASVLAEDGEHGLGCGRRQL